MRADMHVHRTLIPGVLLLAILGLVTFLHADETASKKAEYALSSDRDRRQQS